MIATLERPVTFATFESRLTRDKAPKFCPEQKLIKNSDGTYARDEHGNLMRKTCGKPTIISALFCECSDPNCEFVIDLLEKDDDEEEDLNEEPTRYDYAAGVIIK